MSARDEILSAIRLHRVRNEPRPSPYRPAAIDGDLVAQFAKRATSQAAEVRQLSSMDDVPAAVADILRGRNMQAVIHLPPGSVSDQLPWQSAPGLTRENLPPGPVDASRRRERLLMRPHPMRQRPGIFAPGLRSPC
jgi:hypothetical protein